LPYKIIKKGKLKIGIMGVGIELNGLVPDKHFKGIVYQHPIKCVQKYADILKERRKMPSYYLS
jgi:5'-nucleotidase